MSVGAPKSDVVSLSHAPVVVGPVASPSTGPGFVRTDSVCVPRVLSEVLPWAPPVAHTVLEHRAEALGFPRVCVFFPVVLF